MLARTLFLILVAYLFVLCAVYVMQRKLQYYPDKSHPGTPAANGVPEMQELKVKTEDGLELLAWFAPPKEKDGKVFVYYHGNAGNMGERASKARELIDAGYGVYFCEYRVYGGNPGSLSEEGLYHDARSALRWLEDNGYPASQWVIYGESIGSGPAVQMAKEYQVKYLVLEGGFSSAVDVAKGVYPWLPVDFLMIDRYDNVSKIKDVKASYLHLHGEYDNVINIAYGRKLFEAANHPKEFVIVKGGGHVDLVDFGATKIIQQWLEKGDE